MTVDLDTLRSVIGWVSHVPGAVADVALVDGSRRRIRARPRANEVSVDPFRWLLGEVLRRGDHLYEAGLRRLFSSDPERIVLHDDPPRSTLVDSDRWRMRCRCGTTDVLLSDLALEDALARAHDVLGATVRTPSRHVSVRRDQELGLSVLACRWPAGVSPDDGPVFATVTSRLAASLHG